MSGEAIFIVICVVLIEFIRAFILSFIGFMSLKYVFFRETKKFFCLSICSGIAYATLFLIRFLLTENRSMAVTGWVDYYILFLILAGWLLLTDRSKISLLSTILALFFGSGVVNNFELMIFAAMKVIIPNYLEIKWTSFLAYVVIYLFSVGFIFLLQKLAGNKEGEPLTVWNMILLAGIVSVVTLLIHSYFNISESIDDVNPNAMLPVFLTFLFVVASVILSVKSSKVRYYSTINQLNEEYMAAQAKHFEKVRESDLEMRRLRHDMNNHIICLNELYNGKKYGELGEYLKQLTNTVIEIQAPMRTGNEIVDAIVSEKEEDAKKWKVKIVVDGDFKGINLSAMSLCTILANLLDNAIEAAKAVKEEDRKIIVCARKTGSFWFLTIENNTASFVEISEEMQTTKSNQREHGFGIGNVDREVKKCGGEFRLECRKVTEKYVFMAEVMLPLNSYNMEPKD